jgi:hypothetical protein
MTKVEELRDNVYQYLLDDFDEAGYGDAAGEAAELVDSLITAAREEGTEQERERILSESSCIAADERSLHQSGREFVSGELWYYFPASVLAPAPKEEP